MTNNREKIIQNVDNPSLLDLMRQPDTLQNALPASQSSKNATQVMSKLSQTCHTFHSLFKKQLDQQAAKILCQHVVDGEKKKAEDFLKKNPRLLLVKAPVTDEAGRMIFGTAFQIALGAKDVSPFPDKFGEMAEMIAGYFAKITDGENEKQKQYAEQFPEGFEKLEATRRAQDLEALNTVFAAIKNATTMAVAEAAVTTFQDYLKKQTEGVIKTGYHFNEALFEKALELYSNNFVACGGYLSDKNNLAAVKVLGGIQRYFTANLAQAACDGFGTVVNEKRALSRSKLLEDKVTSFFNSKLGVEHFVYSHYRVGVWTLGATRVAEWETVDRFKSYVKQKQQSWKTYATALASSKAPVCDFLMS